MTTQVDQEKPEELVRRIVAAARPLRIILFGSAARGDMSPESDVRYHGSDPFLVIKSALEEGKELYRAA